LLPWQVYELVGKGNRGRHWPCVLAAVREKHPEPGGVYSGHHEDQEHWDLHEDPGGAVPAAPAPAAAVVVVGGVVRDDALASSSEADEAEDAFELAEAEAAEAAE